MIPYLLRQPGAFRVFWVGQTVSLLGDAVDMIAIPLTAVIILHATAFQMGLLTAAAWLPYVILGIHAGAWADRWGRRRQVMIAADLGRAVLLATIPAAFVLHLLTLAQLYTIVLLTGSLSVFFGVSNATLFNAMVERERFMEGQSLYYGSRSFSFVAGPGLGGLLVQAVSWPIALLVDAASFVVSALALLRISPPEPPTEPASRGHVLGGIRFIARSPILRSSLAATATVNLGQLAFSALAALYAVRFLHIAPATLGFVYGAGATGAIVGSLVAFRISRLIGVGTTFTLGCVLFPAPLLLVPLAGGPMPVVLGMLLAAQFGTAFGVMVLDIPAGAIRAAHVPEQLLARVSGAYTVVNYGVRPVGAVLGGAMGTVLGPREALLIAAAVAVLGVVWLLPSPLPRMRELPQAGY